MHASYYVSKMKNVLYQSPNIELRQSVGHGYGVFAKENFSSGSLLEECSFIEIPPSVKSDYVFLYPRGGTPNVENIKPIYALVFGYATLYNHGDFANATWITDVETQTFVFYAQTDIKKDEEILIYYGGDTDYWNFFSGVKKFNL